MASGSAFRSLILICLMVGTCLAACAGQTWQRDPAVKAARVACGSGPDADYNCLEGTAVAALNPEICRLTGISVDDMCLQSVYEAAGDPTICDRIYLRGVVPNCRAYYAQSPVLLPTGVVALQTITPIPSPTSSPLPAATFTSQPIPTATLTPQYVMDLSGYDPDLYAPIDVSHNPPLISRSDDTVRLVFDFANLFAMYFPVSPIPEGILYYTYGGSETFQTLPLEYEIVHEMESRVIRLPATDQEGGALRYYAEFSVPEAGYTQRYPVAGTINLFAADNLIPVELPVENEVKPGEIVYDFFWGFGEDKVRQATYEGYPMRVGPPAMDVATDGRIALMDPVNERIILFDSSQRSYTSLPMPFTYGFHADLAFNEYGQLLVCDFQGREVEGQIVPVPECYRLSPNGELDASAPAYVRIPGNITRDHQVLDYSDYRLVAPFSDDGQPSSREAQRQRETWEFPKLYVEGEDPYIARYADVQAGIAFEVHSVTPLGVLTEFEKIPQGYLMAFSLGDHIRGVWIDPSGNVLKDVSLPYGQVTEINFNSQAAIGADGSLYALSSTERGIEIHFVSAPEE